MKYIFVYVLEYFVCMDALRDDNSLKTADGKRVEAVDCPMCRSWEGPRCKIWYLTKYEVALCFQR